jgi:hypothetical protein
MSLEEVGVVKHNSAAFSGALPDVKAYGRTGGVPQRKQKMRTWQWMRLSTSCRWRANPRHLADCATCTCPCSLYTRGSLGWEVRQQELLQGGAGDLSNLWEGFYLKWMENRKEAALVLGNSMDGTSCEKRILSRPGQKSISGGQKNS